MSVTKFGVLRCTGTGEAKGPRGVEKSAGQHDKGQQQAYLHLALSIISAFCRIPELASMDDTISKVPILVETLASKYNLSPSFSNPRHHVLLFNDRS